MTDVNLLSQERIGSKILWLRQEKVLLGADLAELYGVETRALNQAVKRNIERFPADFMFRLTGKEVELLVSQNVIPHPGRLGGALPYAFTEQGVAMLSSVLRSERAVQVNVAIMRAFVGLRRMLGANEALSRKLGELERRLEGHDQAIRSLFDAIRQLMAPPAKPHKQIGFHVKEARVPYRVKRRRP